MKRVLLTGAGGFIGRQCLSFLVNAGFEVHALSRTPRDNAHNVHWHTLNLLDEGSPERIVGDVQPTHLLHMAWYAEPGRYWTALENFHWVRASIALLDAFATHGGRRVVMAGTCAEYDWRYGWCSEGVTPTAPTTVYGTCKHSLREMLEAYCRERGLSCAWGRIFFLYGPHEHPSRLVSYVARSLLAGELARCSSGEQFRDFLHVEDVAGAFAAILGSEIQGAVNIGSGVPIAIKAVVQAIGEKIGASDKISLGAQPLAKNDPPLLVADVGRLSGEVGWYPKWSLSEGLDATIDWWRTYQPGR
jgi:nucleoside-diphosphate-sugar epimerase